MHEIKKVLALWNESHFIDQFQALTIRKNMPEKEKLFFQSHSDGIHS